MTRLQRFKFSRHPKQFGLPLPPKESSGFSIGHKEKGGEWFSFPARGPTSPADPGGDHPDVLCAIDAKMSPAPMLFIMSPTHISGFANDGIHPLKRLDQAAMQNV